MSALLHSTQDPEEICLQYSKNEQESIFQSFSDVTESTVGAKPIISVNNEPIQISGSDTISEVQCIKKEENSGDSSFVKSRETHETSPFKQAMRGFVLNKLSKKVGSSHILSGITGKLVKKLEESKESSSSLIQNAAFEKNQIIPQLKDSSAELTLDAIPCEMKSVVANDLHEIASVEEAIECFEEAKTTVIKSAVESNMCLKPKITSRSLPSSPAHHFVRRASDIIDNSSDNEEKSLESVNISSVSAKLFQNIETSTSNNANEIELVDINAQGQRPEVSICSPFTSLESNRYPENAYGGWNEGPKKPSEINKYSRMFYTLRKLFISMPSLHWLLLISIIVRKHNFFSAYYIDDIFDVSVISYISFALFTKLQKSVQTIPLHATYDNTQLELTTIDLSETDKALRGTVKILKGNYDKDQQDLQPTELVTICIEDNYLKISQPQPKDESDACMPYEIYYLCGAKVSLVPKGLNKKRIFSKKYPICLTLPSTVKKMQSTSGSFEDMHSEEKCDFISFVAYEDGLVEMSKERALYLFALTNREKEFWYQALMKILKSCDAHSYQQQNAPLGSSSHKFDVSALSFSSLLEMNSDENLSIAEASCENEPEMNLLPVETKLSIEFEAYMNIIWENYQRVLHVFDDSLPSETIHISSKKSEDKLNDSSSVEWLNVAVGRIFYDFITQKNWCDEVMVRIQKKLDKIDMPNFVEPLTVTEVFMGTSVPQLHAVSSPKGDNFGVWLDFDFTYIGSFHMTLKTRLKIPKEKQLSSTEVSECVNFKQSMDASDTSDDDGGGSKRSPKHKLINKIEKWMTHKHFQTVAQSKFVKKYVGDISNMPLTLTVEVNMLEGILALNIPPAPTDRIWYGFRKDPTLSLTASPKVGSHEINLSAVVQMIERKLLQAFKKAIVLPNMDDLIIPIMFTPVYDE